MCFTCFLLSTAYLDIVHYGGPKFRIISSINFPLLRRLFTTIQYLTFICVVCNHSYGKIRHVVILTLQALVGDIESTTFRWLQRILSVSVVLTLVVLAHAGTPPSVALKYRRRSSIRQRPPSARIQALQRQQLEKQAEEERANNAHRQRRPPTAKRRGVMVLT